MARYAIAKLVRVRVIQDDVEIVEVWGLDGGRTILTTIGLASVAGLVVLYVVVGGGLGQLGSQEMR